MNSSEYISASVDWFSEEKKYGFVKCYTSPPISAYLPKRELDRKGIFSVKPGQPLRVKIHKPYEHKSPAVYDVTLIPAFDEESVYKPNYCSRKSPSSASDVVRPKLAQTAKLPHLKSSTNEANVIKVNKSKMLPIKVHDRNGTEKHQKVLNCKTNVVSESSSVPKKIVSFDKLQQNNNTNGNKNNKEALQKDTKPLPIMTPGMVKLKNEIDQKKRIIGTTNISMLPDKGQRLKDSIQKLEEQLEQLNLQKHVEVQSTDAQPNSSTENTSNPKQTSEIKTSELQRKDFKDLTLKTHQVSSRSILLSSSFSTTSVFSPKCAEDESDLAETVTEGFEELQASLENVPPPTEEISDPEGLMVKLMSHQNQALRWLTWREKADVSGGILADDMGLGKTLTMIAFILKQNEESDEVYSPDSKLTPSNSTLIVAPASLIYHWQSEIKKRCRKGLLSVHLFHGPHREKDSHKLAEFDIVLTTYDLVRRTDNLSTSTLNAIAWRRIILDEAHQIRNPKSRTSQSLCNLTSKSRWGVTGTPVQNQADDMFSMIKFLHYKPFDDPKVWNKHIASSKLSKGGERLQSLVSLLVLRRMKDQKGKDGKPYVSLPKRSFEIHRLQLSSVEKEVYLKLKKTYHDKYKSSHMLENTVSNKEKSRLNATALLVMLLRLRQCCCHLSLLATSFDPEILKKDKENFAIEDLFSNLSLDITSKEKNIPDLTTNDQSKDKYFQASATSTKVQTITDLILQIKLQLPNDKIVIISQWTSMLKIMATHLKMIQVSCAMLDGSVSAKKRMDMVDEFNNNPITPKVLLLSLQAGGVGLNLIGGNHLFLVDMHWNPALEKQAFDRVYRVGQKKNVYVHKFIMLDTVEEEILKLQEKKLSIADYIMDGARHENKLKLSSSNLKVLLGIS